MYLPSSDSGLQSVLFTSKKMIVDKKTTAFGFLVGLSFSFVTPLLTVLSVPTRPGRGTLSDPHEVGIYLPLIYIPLLCTLNASFIYTLINFN